MARKLKAELLTAFTNIVGDNNSDDVLQFIEDLSDSLSDETTSDKDYTALKKDYDELKASYDKLDNDWRKKYRDRFTQPTTKEDEKGPEEKTDEEKEEERAETITIDDLFTDEQTTE